LNWEPKSRLAAKNANYVMASSSGNFGIGSLCSNYALYHLDFGWV